MRTRILGQGLEVSAVGLGTMGFSHGYGPGVDEAGAIDLIRAAFDLGCTFYDTAEGYAAGDNERLVGKALAPIRDQVVLATKFRVTAPVYGTELSRHIREHLDASLTRLGTEHVELYYLHRVPDTTPVEDIAAVMGELINDGKIGGWGQSQASEDQIRRAHAVTPLTAIQSEYSIMERMFEADVLPACAELGIGFVPFSPLASGFLSGKVTADDTFTGDDVRRVITRFDAANIRANQPLLDLITEFAQTKGAQPPRFHSHGCCTSTTSSCPSPALASSPGSRRTSAPPTSTSPPMSSPKSKPNSPASPSTATAPTKTSPSSTRPTEPARTRPAEAPQVVPHWDAGHGP